MKNSSFAALLLAAAALVTPAAHSAVITFDLGNYGSDPIGVEVTLDDESMAGFLTVTASITPSDDHAIGDLLGFWLDFAPTAPTPSVSDDFVHVSLTGLSASGGITPVYPGAYNLGPGININGDITNLFSPDMGFIFGDPGIGNGKTDIQSGTFKLKGFTVDDIDGAAARVTSVGTGDNREGSDKLFGPTPPPPGEEEVPEPATVTMMAGGLLALVWAKRRRQKA